MDTTHRLDRRDFLRRLGAGAAALAVRPHRASASPTAPARAARPKRILVLGAGMAGLSAASELIEHGHDVTVLEARTRPGGRVLTLREPFADGLYAEAGAMQVFDTHARVLRHVQRLGLEIDPIRPSGPGSIVHVLGRRVELRPGERVAWPFPVYAAERGLDPRAVWERYVVPLLPAVQAAEERGSFPAPLERYDRITFSELLSERGASPAAIAILAAGLPSGLGDGSDQVSALNLLREAAHRQARRQSFTIRGGTDRLPRELAARVADRIHYGTPVVRLEQDAGGVRAIAAQGGTVRRFNADRLICTIPFTVLRHLEIAPALSPGKRAAVEQLPYTSVTRVFVQLRRRFWSAEWLSGNASTDLPVMGVYERSLNQPGTRGILEAYIAGDSARRFATLGEAERLAAALDGMAEVYPRIREEYEGGTSKSWDDDPWSRGAYAWFRPGQMTSLLPAVARPEGRIHFAGEHTSASPGWVEGALESAERVVREIAALEPAPVAMATGPAT